ncbi:D-hexose-6-phosphate mutarotase [Pseudoalteromonas denitrificans]|jgi:glucose-6-phosphate 1-epimerase|uniref:Putative glucose-6-phosphate 1-epimerase n=1 Tax=Pseudoalteromonas denitrificans DSM 6059 TaxID=1123010 RepID=A0A1I1MG22_9GAMM|nr:D-hexose-6-phosphate mutarotase [Pseudoalteromonas denitrificans]SFC82038.1 glucose-6-phosphate 1-epimerase [Pseudoalteromonas denitrificans DSM 6059]
MKLSPSVSIQQTETGLEYISINSNLCGAKIFLQGAQITQFIPKNQKPLIWVSQDEDYSEGKSIRGGIPICWPWFGLHEKQGWPIHGVARTQIWRAEEVNELDDYIEIILSLPMNQIDKNYWPHKTALKVTFRLSTSLSVYLTNTNLGNAEISFTQALHTYFPTPDIKSTHVDGLQGAQYIEFGQGPFKQNDIVSFERETDMVYNNASQIQNIITQDGTINVTRENSTSCVLWNPWIEKSKRLSNFSDDEYQKMLCLEAANVKEDTITLSPGESHTLATIIKWHN